MEYRRRPPRSQKDRALAQFRGYWEPQDLSAFERPIADALRNTMGKLGLKDRFSEEQIFAAWSELVDDFIAQHAKPVSLERGRLRIQVLNPSVHYELDRMRGQILRRMQERFGEKAIRDVRFTLG
jgi:predicted nucleic acid-binding Zn ribbon protein